MTINECYDCLKNGQLVWYAEMMNSGGVYAYPVHILSVGKETISVKIHGGENVNPLSVFLTRRDFLSACQNLKWYHFKEKIKRTLGAM